MIIEDYVCIAVLIKQLQLRHIPINSLGRVNSIVEHTRILTKHLAKLRKDKSSLEYACNGCIIIDVSGCVQRHPDVGSLAGLLLTNDSRREEGFRRTVIL